MRSNITPYSSLLILLSRAHSSLYPVSGNTQLHVCRRNETHTNVLNKVELLYTWDWKLNRGQVQCVLVDLTSSLGASCCIISCDSTHSSEVSSVELETSVSEGKKVSCSQSRQGSCSAILPGSLRILSSDIETGQINPDEIK